MISLPIPSTRSNRRLCDLTVDRVNLGDVAADLSAGHVERNQTIHLDPDIDATLVARTDGWRAAFGQASRAQTHLCNQRVGVGDVFLFYGWFRRAEKQSSRYRYVPDAPDVHVIFGWLQVGEVWDLTSQRQALLAAHPAQASHPHVADPAHFKSANTLYIASERLVSHGKTVHQLPGTGYFRNYADRLQLTATGKNRSVWRLPTWFFPSDGKPALSYHGDVQRRWSRDSEWVELHTVGRGQEFVLDADAYPEAISWLTTILR
jgi:hypothetical protein